MSEENPLAPEEPRRIIHEVCRRATRSESEIRWGRDDDEWEYGHDPLIRLGVDGVVVITSVTLYEHEDYDPPPWVLQGIQTRGWFVRRRNAPSTGLVFHGAVDWKVVADGLAAAVSKHKKPTQAERDALDNFAIALAEEALAQESHERTEEPEEGSTDG